MSRASLIAPGWKDANWAIVLSVVHPKRAVWRVSEMCTESQSTPLSSSQVRYSPKSMPAAPTSTGRTPSRARPKEMFGAQPPRRTSRSSTRNDTESLSSCSTTRESENLPLNDIRWSEAIEPAISRDMGVLFWWEEPILARGTDPSKRRAEGVEE